MADGGNRQGRKHKAKSYFDKKASAAMMRHLAKPAWSLRFVFFFIGLGSLSYKARGIRDEYGISGGWADAISYAVFLLVLMRGASVMNCCSLLLTKHLIVFLRRCVIWWRLNWIFLLAVDCRVRGFLLLVATRIRGRIVMLQRLIFMRKLGALQFRVLASRCDQTSDSIYLRR